MSVYTRVIFFCTHYLPWILLVMIFALIGIGYYHYRNYHLSKNNEYDELV